MSKIIFPNDQFTNTVDEQPFSLFLQTVFSQSLFFISIFPKCIFQNCIFPTTKNSKVYFSTVHFFKVYFSKVHFSKCIFQNLSFQRMLGLHIFWVLRVYYSRQEKNQRNNGGTGTWSQVDLLTCWCLAAFIIFYLFILYLLSKLFSDIVPDNSIINIKQPEVQAPLDPIPGPFGPSFLWNLGFVTHAITSFTSSW